MVREADERSGRWVCRRCGARLNPGRGDFYVIKIEAVADPNPPVFTENDLQRDHTLEAEVLIAKMRNLSEEELTEQVYRRLGFYLCNSCYRAWIENPTL